MRIAINGIGIAGPALAYWLQKSGHEVTLIEQAPHLRAGGYVIDFWGLGYDIAEKMGLIPRIRELGYQVEEVRYVDARGRKCGGFGTDVFVRMTGDRFTSLRRTDLSATLYDSLGENTETIFGDSIAGIEDTGRAAHVTFDHSAPREFDLVIGADGLHSRVRQLVFGAEDNKEYSFGYHVAAFEAAGYQPRDELVFLSHNIPGRQVSRFTMREDTSLFLFIFRDEYMRPNREPTTMEERKGIVNHAFAAAGWECPQILEAMKSADDLYFDRVSQIRMNHWSRGRTAVIGDAAACVSLLAGEGTGLAMAEAYVLAGELRRSGGDYATAFARYEELMMPFLERKQASAAKFASAFAPKTAFGLWFRDLVTRLFRIPFVADYFVGRDLHDDIEIPDYGF
ncbi:MAG TPA: FAD-binding domain [Lacipirellulaceae bacterium]|jgi:2-polyprenyl-6-methoxyphenol hydroxylase-like FAD-dependent oxidoreductase|nr:FAD-binding domain [Lacipirellulaceae bacterium]